MHSAQFIFGLRGPSFSLGRLPLRDGRALLRCSDSQPCDSNENREREGEDTWAITKFTNHQHTNQLQLDELISPPDMREEAA